MKLKVLDLFSGIGGFSLGLERTGHFETVAFCEIDEYCKLILKKHWKGIKIYDDVKEITKERLQADGIESPTIITGGVPCQAFSVAGLQKGTSDPRHLWPEMFRVIKEFKSKWIIVENVTGLVNVQDGVVFETLCTDLESEGYEVQTFNIPVAGVGAPHLRQRIWVVAHTDTGNVETGRERQGKIRKGHQEEGVSDHVASGSEIEGQRQNSWSFEPDVGRMVDAVPGRIHRLKGLGNAICPQIAEEIGRAIIKAESSKM